MRSLSANGISSVVAITAQRLHSKVCDSDDGENPNLSVVKHMAFSQTGQIGTNIDECSTIVASSAPYPAVETRERLGGGANRQGGVGDGGKLPVYSKLYTMWPARASRFLTNS
jgi:hypothetical protein